MIFRNATVFQFSANTARALLSGGDTFTLRLRERALRPVEGLALESIGWVSPFGNDDPALCVACDRRIGLTLGSETRVIPSSVVAKAVIDRAAELERERGKRVGGRERRRIREEVLQDMIPRAFISPGRVNCYLDLGVLVVDTPARRVAEQVLTLLRETFDSLPAVPTDPEESIRALFTGWLMGGNMPIELDLGDAAVLRDAADSAASVRLRGKDLASDEVQEHLRSGMQCTELSLRYGTHYSFRLDDAFTLRSIRMLDIVDQLEVTEHDSMRAEVDARFALFTLTFAPVLRCLFDTFRMPQPRDRGDVA